MMLAYGKEDLTIRLCSLPMRLGSSSGWYNRSVYHIQITQRLGMRSLDHSLVHRWISGRGCVSDMLCRLLSI
uniref:Uncharacterized protein n=1 Tax=Brassica campestris TaxID=3711 RepID=A0A3P6B769_BRACM|nr:unnamed protein product [Brassica rapa]